MDELQAQIEEEIESLDPQVELIALERPGGETIRLFVDHPEGVGLDLCSKVTNRFAICSATTPSKSHPRDSTGR